MRLTNLECDTVQPQGRMKKLSDGGGLQLWVQPPAQKYWRFAYRHAGKQKVLAIGAYPAIPLDDARAAARKLKAQLAEGRYPAAVRRAEKQEVRARAVTFRQIAEEYVERLHKEGRAPTTVSKTEWLLSFAYPFIGERSIMELKPIDVLAPLRDVEARGRLEKARRLRSTIGSVFRYAIATART